MFVSADSDYNTDWDASCNVDPEYASFTWDYFTDNSGGANYPTSCSNESCEEVSLITLSGGMITSSGNLYGISSPLYININSGYSPIDNITLTLTTLGTTLDYSSTNLNVGNATVFPVYEILSEEADDWGGASVTVEFNWGELSDYSLSQGWSLEFVAAGAHMSLDQVILEWNSSGEDCCGIPNGDGSSCYGSGDVNGDGAANVNDIVIMVEHIISSLGMDECAESASDTNEDGYLNVLDVIIVVDIILGNGMARVDMDVPNAVELVKGNNQLSYISDIDGLVGFEITISHEEFFEFEINEDAFISDYETLDHMTKMLIVIESSDVLFHSNRDFEIIDCLAGNVNGEISVKKVNSVQAFMLSDAYPNPFNPVTTVNLNIDISSNISLKVLNLSGQIVETLFEGKLSIGNHPFNWDASNYASGMYILRAEKNGQTDIQKIMLLK